MMKRFRFWRKLIGGTWYKHSYTKDAQQLSLGGSDWWARYGNLNRYSEVIKIEIYGD